MWQEIPDFKGKTFLAELLPRGGMMLGGLIPMVRTMWNRFLNGTAS